MKECKIKQIIKKYSPLTKFGKTSLIRLICGMCNVKLREFKTIKKLSEDQIKKLENIIGQFNKIGLSAPIFGYIEFMGDNYPYKKDVFIPKLTTETLVKSIVKNGNLTNKSLMLDLCTGSGCVAISVTKETGCKAFACDIDDTSLITAEQNNKNFGGNVKFFKMNVLEEWSILNNKKFNIIAANPPYWAENNIKSNQNMIKTNKVEHYSGGENGLLFIKTIIDNSIKYLEKNGMLFIEFSSEQAKQIKEIMNLNFKKIKCYKDWHGLPRVISAIKK